MTVKWEDNEYATIEDAIAALGGTRQLWLGRIRAGRTRNKRKGGVRPVIYRGTRYDSLADAARAHDISREAVRQWVNSRAVYVVTDENGDETVHKTCREAWQELPYNAQQIGTGIRDDTNVTTWEFELCQPEPTGVYFYITKRPDEDNRYADE